MSDALASLRSGHSPTKLEAKLPAGAYPPRLALVHPGRWQWYADAPCEDGGAGAWLPQINMLPAVPGVGMCGTEGDLMQRMIPAITTVSRDGQIVCPLDKWAEDYLRPVEAEGGTAYLFAWQTMRSVGGNPTLISDQPVFYGWLRRFAEMLPPIDPETALTRIREASTAALLVMQSAQRDPSQESDAVEWATRVQRMRAGAGLAPDPRFARLALTTESAPALCAPEDEPSLTVAPAAPVKRAR